MRSINQLARHYPFLSKIAIRSGSMKVHQSVYNRRIQFANHKLPLSAHSNRSTARLEWSSDSRKMIRYKGGTDIDGILSIPSHAQMRRLKYDSK